MYWKNQRGGFYSQRRARRLPAFVDEGMKINMEKNVPECLKFHTSK
jgi:hypothetical protein